MSVRLSPVLAGLGTYPFVRLEQARVRLRAAGVEIIDFGIGEPREETPAFIRAALADALEPLSTYPKAVGLPALRSAVAAWAQRRFGATLDPDREIVPTLGTKEVIFHLPQVVAGEVVAVGSRAARGPVGGWRRQPLDRAPLGLQRRHPRLGVPDRLVPLRVGDHQGHVHGDDVPDAGRPYSPPP